MGYVVYDASRWSVVAQCTLCGWQDVGHDRNGARQLAQEHEKRQHPDQSSVRRAALMRSVRRAAGDT